MHTTVLHYTTYITQCFVVYRSLNKVPGHFAFAHLILNPSHQDACWMFSYRRLRSNVTQVFLSITFLLQVCSLLLLWRRVGWWDFTAEVGCEQRFKDDVLYPDVSGSVGCSLPQLLCIYVYICGSCEFLLGWALYRSALQRRLLISAWGNLSVDSVFLIIPAVLHPIALAVTYRNEWQRAAHSRAVLWVHYKSRFSLEVQPRKLSARSDFHSQEKLFFHSRVDLNPFSPPPTDFTDLLSVQQRKRSPRDVLKCCIHYGCVQCTVQPLWHQLH